MTTANNAVLVSLSISTWAANSMDRGVSAQVANEHGTDVKLGRFWKTLVSKGKDTSLGLIYAVERETRNFHYANTLPWMHDGMRILPVANYGKYMEKMREFKRGLEAAVANFLDEYEALKMQAKLNLKSLYREEDYPTKESLARAFKLDISVSPLPQAATFLETELPGEEIEKAKKALEADLLSTFKRANNELWDRLYSVVCNLQDRLNGPERFLRENALDNAKDLMELLPRLNVGNDTKLEELRTKLKESFEGLTASELRVDKPLRDLKVSEVSAIEATMAAYLGVSANPASTKLEFKNAA